MKSKIQIKSISITSVALIALCTIWAIQACDKKDNKSYITIKNIEATVFRDCIDYMGIKDTFSIALDEYPEGILSVYPSEPIKSDFRQSGLKVVVSGRIYKESEANRCPIPLNAKYAAPKVGNKFIITKISKK